MLEAIGVLRGLVEEGEMVADRAEVARLKIAQQLVVARGDSSLQSMLSKVTKGAGS